MTRHPLVARPSHGQPTQELEAPIIETRRVGSVLRVSAIDPTSLTEVSLQAPLGTSPVDLERLVLRKLARRLAG